MKLFAPITKMDTEQRTVSGYASTEALDSQNEIIRLDALKAAMPAYLKFGNIREMHQPSAVGIAVKADFDDVGLHLTAQIVDAAAWEKVEAGVYKGFSIGGRVKSRDKAQKHIITGIDLNEISLVDRPANPGALFDIWKADGAMPELTVITDEKDQPMPEDTIDLTKASAKTNIQAMHDHSCALGADCDSNAAKALRDGDLAKRVEAFDTLKADHETLQKAHDDIAKAMGDMAAENDALKAEIVKLKKQPEAPKGVLKVIDKAADVTATADDKTVKADMPALEKEAASHKAFGFVA